MSSGEPADEVPTGPAAYVDTCLVSGLAKRDLRRKEHDALREVLRRRKAGEIQIVTSAITLEELERMPPDARELHEDIDALLTDVPAVQETRTDSGLTLLGVGGGRREDPILTRLKATLSDESDAPHVFQAIKNGVDIFLTDDERTILSHAAVLEEQFGIRARKPSQVLRELH